MHHLLEAMARDRIQERLREAEHARLVRALRQKRRAARAARRRR